jgi:cytochrome P450
MHHYRPDRVSALDEPVVDVVGDPSGGGPLLRAAAADSPTAIDAASGAVLVFGYDEAHRLAHDPGIVGVGLTWFDLMGIGDGLLRQWYGSLMFTNEGEGHDRLRRLVSRAFTPRAAERLRQAAASMVEDRCRSLVDAGGGDLVASFGDLPMRVMCRLLGVPDEDVAVFGRWADSLSPVFGLMAPEQIDAAADALQALLDYVSALVEARRRSPADDLITALLEAEDEGDRLSHEELIAMVANLLVGGHDTTASQIGCTLLTVLRHPELIEAVRGGGAPVASVINETIRFEPSIPVIPRTAARPVVIGDRSRPTGTMVLLSLLTANRDPRVWARPDEVVANRFDQPDAPRLLSFGSGPHYCLGASLARMTLEETLAHLAGLSLTPSGDLDTVEWRQVLGRSPVALDVALA